MEMRGEFGQAFRFQGARAAMSHPSAPKETLQAKSLQTPNQEFYRAFYRLHLATKVSVRGVGVGRRGPLNHHLFSRDVQNKRALLFQPTPNFRSLAGGTSEAFSAPWL